MLPCPLVAAHAGKSPLRMDAQCMWWKHMTGDQVGCSSYTAESHASDRMHSITQPTLNNLYSDGDGSIAAQSLHEYYTVAP